jgi:hypothetical protein
MGVPKDNITQLLDNEATRHNIITALGSLVKNDKIEKDNAIVIFFAGHGARCPAPVEWSPAQSKVEILCPVDVGVAARQGKSLVTGIPDRTIAALLNKISVAKGNNIVSYPNCRRPLPLILNPTVLNRF